MITAIAGWALLLFGRFALHRKWSKANDPRADEVDAWAMLLMGTILVLIGSFSVILSKVLDHALAVLVTGLGDAAVRIIRELRQ